MPKILSLYPFKNIGIELMEGFTVYDGHLLDEVNTPHKGIDYALYKNNTFISFEVFSMHRGIAYQGLSKSWGKFVCIYYPDLLDGFKYSTIYAHLDTTSSSIPFLENEKTILKEITAGEYLGQSGTSGWTNNIIQLHIELHKKDLKSGITIKCDPYTIYDRKNSGKYPMPGQQITTPGHFWRSDFPDFIS